MVMYCIYLGSILFKMGFLYPLGRVRKPRLGFRAIPLLNLLQEGSIDEYVKNSCSNPLPYFKFLYGRT